MELKYSRKEFVKVGVVKAGECLADLLRWGAGALGGRPGAPPLRGATPSSDWVRPPGALSPAAFRQICTRCDDCLRACPHWVIRKAGPEMGPELEATPIVIPKENPCLFCEGLPCIAACKEGALVLPAGDARPAIGIADVDGERCFMGRGQPCDYCVTHCPEEPKAITASRVGEPAKVDRDRCTGCGKCAQICPAEALRIRPRPLAAKGAS